MTYLLLLFDVYSALQIKNRSASALFFGYWPEPSSFAACHIYLSITSSDPIFRMDDIYTIISIKPAIRVGRL